MHISEFLQQEAVLADLRARTKDEAFKELLAPLLDLHPELKNIDIIEILKKRDSLGTVAVGDGCAIPHGKIPGVDSLFLAVGRSIDGIECNAPDKKKCHIFFLILSPENGAGKYLQLLALLARKAKSPLFRSQILLAKDSEQLWQILTAV